MPPDAAGGGPAPYGRRIDARVWGVTPEERRQAFACDRHLDAPDDVYHRAVSVEAPGPTVFRWLCQLKLAPYSYDWLDNFGRRSPRHLVPGVDHLEVGQRVMRVFRVVEFEPDGHLTLLARNRVFGNVAVSYGVAERDSDRCRLVVKMLVEYPRLPLFGRLLRAFLPAGDLVMMRRQLLNLRARAEDTSREEVSRRAASLP